MQLYCCTPHACVHGVVRDNITFIEDLHIISRRSQYDLYSMYGHNIVLFYTFLSDLYKIRYSDSSTLVQDVNIHTPHISCASS